MTKNFCYRCIRKGRTYTISEAAQELESSERTIRNWIKSGALGTVSDRKPLLIYGHSLRAHIVARQSARKVMLGLTEFYCFKCKSPRAPFGMEIETRFTPARRLLLLCRCSICRTPCHKTCSSETFSEIQSRLNGRT